MERFTLQRARRVYKFLLTFLCCVSMGKTSEAQNLYVGTAEVDISPKLPIALAGQGHLRVATEAETPLQVSIMTIESRNGKATAETVFFAACDLVDIPPAYQAGVRKAVKKLLPSIDTAKVILTATHTHTAPVMDTLFSKYPIPPEITQPSAFENFFIERVSAGIVKAWNNRVECTTSWGLTHAVVGYNRRSSYLDGTALMYGGTYFPGFAGIEGYEDHDVNTLFFWNKKQELIATGVSVACPAQKTENGTAVNADYWHEVRLALKKKFGDRLCVIGWIAAAGDQSPHVMYRHKADVRMHTLSGRKPMEEIGRRISNAVIEAHDLVKKDQHQQAPLVHKYENLPLPVRIITHKEYLDAKKTRDEVAAKIAADNKLAEKLRGDQFFNDKIVKRYENQQQGKQLLLPTEIHVVRLGDIVICTNPFELYTEYGIRIQGRSKALQTFVVQLAGEQGYLATERAVKGGGYSATVFSSIVGAEGGQMLVDRTVDLIEEMMKKEK